MSASLPAVANPEIGFDGGPLAGQVWRCGRTGNSSRSAAARQKHAKQGVGV